MADHGASLPRLEAAPRLCHRSACCAGAELAEKGRAVLFDVLHFREPARAFALRFDGRVVAYLNRCVHVPTELDWQPGEFLDGGREFIICAIHGASLCGADRPLHRRPVRARATARDRDFRARRRRVVAADARHAAGVPRLTVALAAPAVRRGPCWCEDRLGVVRRCVHALRQRWHRPCKRELPTNSSSPCRSTRHPKTPEVSYP